MVDHYRELNVWQKAMELVDDVYRVTATFPKSEIYGLTSQIRRSAVSIPSNIAEGAARKTTKDFLRFLSITLGSLAELETQIMIAQRQGFISESDIFLQSRKMSDIGKMLNGLQKSLANKLADDYQSQATDHRSQATKN
jgi:four helix bundle protein